MSSSIGSGRRAFSATSFKSSFDR